MNHALAMGIGEGRADLLEEAGSGLRVPRPAVEGVPQSSPSEPPHDEIGTVGVPPVVVQRNDVGMFELRYELRFGFEPANEFGPVHEFGPDHLHRHLAADRRLVSAVNDSELSSPNLLPQLVAANGSLEACPQHRREPVDAKRRELRREPLCEELKDLLGTAQALEPKLPKRSDLPSRFGARKGGVGVG